MHCKFKRLYSANIVRNYMKHGQNMIRESRKQSELINTLYSVWCALSGTLVRHVYWIMEVYINYPGPRKHEWAFGRDTVTMDRKLSLLHKTKHTGKPSSENKQKKNERTSCYVLRNPTSYELCKFKTLQITRCKHTKRRTNLKKKKTRGCKFG